MNTLIKNRANKYKSLKEAVEKNKLKLKGANLVCADLEGAKLRGADLEGADLRKANLKGADLREANLKGADLRNAYIKNAYLREANLEGADLGNAYLTGVDIIRANLRGANLEGADFANSYLIDADLEGANLRKAYLRNADLEGVNLRGACLREAYFRGADFLKTNLTGADLKGAKLKDTNLEGANLENIKNYTNSHDLFEEIIRRQDVRVFTPEEWEIIGIFIVHRLCWDTIINRFGMKAMGIFKKLSKLGFREFENEVAEKCDGTLTDYCCNPYSQVDTLLTSVRGFSDNGWQPQPLAAVVENERR